MAKPGLHTIYGLHKDDLLPGLHRAIAYTHSALIKYVAMKIKDDVDRASCVFLVWQIHVPACGLKQATISTWVMIGACLMYKHRLSNNVQTSNITSVI
jgi:hypothetical protein